MKTRKTTTLNLDRKLFDDNNEHWNSQYTLSRMLTMLAQVAQLTADVRRQADLALQLSTLQAPHGLWAEFYTTKDSDCWRTAKAAEVLALLNVNGSLRKADVYNVLLAVRYWREFPVNEAGKLVHDIRSLEIASAGIEASIQLLCNEAMHLSANSGGDADRGNLYTGATARVRRWADWVSRDRFASLLCPQVCNLRIAGVSAVRFLRTAAQEYLEGAMPSRPIGRPLSVPAGPAV